MKKGADDFYIGYLPQAPAALAAVTRRRVAALAGGALLLGVAGAWALPYFGAGVFEFGREREFRGVLRCETVPVLVSSAGDQALVGSGKRGAPLELCGSNGGEVVVTGTRIARDGRELLEVSTWTAAGENRGVSDAAPAAVALGRVALTGEIVDAKCFFGVMNPGEGATHRACAVQCLRGGVPAVFVVRDRSGAQAHLLLAGPQGQPINDALLRWTALPVSAEGELWRQGRWLVWRIDPAALRTAR